MKATLMIFLLIVVFLLLSGSACMDSFIRGTQRDNSYREQTPPSKIQCYKCNGSGVIMEECMICRGSGWSLGYKCVTCDGRGFKMIKCSVCSGRGWQ